MKEILKQVLTAVLVAAILWLGSEIRNLVMTVHDLRADNDRLYYEVSELKAYVQELAEKVPSN
jgi:outer membrane murein-binding lipoprotein Lpp